MASEVRVNQIQNRSGLSTVTFNDTNVTFSDDIVVAVGNSITVGNSFIGPRSIGIGSTTTTGRNAGVGTAKGTIIYNDDTGTLQFYDGTK
jgi:hypothetical protein